MTGPHDDARIATAGTPREDADAAVVLVHGRGATAESILGMSAEFDADGVAYLAPQAARNTWYPNSFLAPVESNEPGRSSGLALLDRVVSELADDGVPTERVALVGFSQGGCLASEFAARNPTRYGCVAALSGGLIGPTIDPSDYEGSLEGTPAFFGCSDVDPHIPLERVRESVAVFERLEADVDERIYEGMGHGVNQDEIDAVGEMIAALVDGGDG